LVPFPPPPPPPAWALTACVCRDTCEEKVQKHETFQKDVLLDLGRLQQVLVSVQQLQGNQSSAYSLLHTALHLQADRQRTCV